MCQCWRAAFITSKNNNRRSQQTNCNFSIIVPPSHTFLVLSLSHPFQTLLLKRSENGFHSGRQSGQTLTCSLTHAHPSPGPLLECQVSSSSGSSAAWPRHNGEKMLVGRRERLCCVECVCGNNLRSWCCHSLFLSDKNRNANMTSVIGVCVCVYHDTPAQPCQMG